MIAHNRPFISPEDRAAVDAVLASGWIAQGPAVKGLEECFIRQHGGGAACAVASGTAALFLALQALGAASGQAKVAVPSYACSALLNAVFMAGAQPRVVDVLPDTFCLDPDALQRQAPDAGFAIAVHTYGAVADCTAMKRTGRVVIEDCCHAPAGSVPVLGEVGEAAVYSFYATKVVTGGQGGLVWSRDPAVVDKVLDYRQFDCREHYVPRFNFQMTDIQAALAHSQMQRIDAIRERRAFIASEYLSAIPSGLSAQAGLAETGRMVYRFVVLAPNREIRNALQTYLKANGIECAVPVEKFELLHRYLKLDPEQYPHSERLTDITLSLPMHLGLSSADVSSICGVLSRFQI